MANPKYAASDKPVPVAELVTTLSDGTKVKRRIPEHNSSAMYGHFRNAVRDCGKEENRQSHPCLLFGSARAG